MKYLRYGLVVGAALMIRQTIGHENEEGIVEIKRQAKKMLLSNLFRIPPTVLTWRRMYEVLASVKCLLR